MMRLTALFATLWIGLLSSVAAEGNLLTAIAVGMMGEEGGDSLFYYPTRDVPFTPKKHGYVYEDVFFEASDGVRLHGWWMPAKGKKKAAVVYAHGNAGSVAHHFVFVYWLINAGYDVFLYDYRGYGQSEGKVNKAGIVKDAQAAIAYAGERSEKLIVFGHSLGGAKSIAAVGMSAPDSLVAVVVDSTFASYRDMAERVAGARARSVVSASYDPVEYVAKLPDGVPLLVVHGTADETIPFAQAQKLYAAAQEPKRLMTVVGGNHVNCFFIREGRYRKDLLKWMERAVSE
ncbi:alpha/beta hydrolase [Rubritalea spongiae]|uniref:Alpha/beta hydrolase n=1 Tax=Rubritalea spongiae TaxID=430797 RepID=A0ABW5E3W2_9BACT